MRVTVLVLVLMGANLDYTCRYADALALPAAAPASGIWHLATLYSVSTNAISGSSMYKRYRVPVPDRFELEIARDEFVPGVDQKADER